MTDATNLADTLAGLVTTRDVYDYCELRIPYELIDGAIRDFAESLAYAAEGEDSPADAGEYVEDVSDHWRFEFAPSWIIYTGESEEVIARIGLSEVMDTYRYACGRPAEDAAQLIGFVADDLSGAVIAAFENVDWGDEDD